MQKKRNNPQANPSEFAYVRVALKLTLEISFNAIIALAFSISKHIRIEHNIRYSVNFFFFCIKPKSETLIFRYFNIIFDNNILKILIERKKISLRKSILYYLIIREETREKTSLTITLTIYLDC